ncbi:substrate-binding periplasmic protein [Maridesulfovibrio sp.]|uniref:substrate-binding periplasmic protein n=1 Tax=Maridesulfovibrio sp. TaxID=2795000 RepID=UPI003B009E42
MLSYIDIPYRAKLVILLLPLFSLMGFVQHVWASGVMRIVYYDDFAPYSYSEKGKTKGIFVDILDGVLRDRLGIRLSHKSYPWERAQKLVKCGKADAFVTIETPERLSYAESSYVSILPVELSVFISRKSPRYEHLRNVRTVEELSAYSLCQYIGNGWARQNLTSHEIHWLPNTKLVLKGLAAGRCDASVGLSVSTSYILNQIKLINKVEELPLNLSR